MELIKYNGNELLMYASIQDLPIERFQIYNRAVMIDAGIGSNISDFNNKVATIRKWIGQDSEKANTALSNLSQSFYLIIEKTSPELMSFVALIREINGHELKDSDLTDEGIKRIIKDLSKKGLTFGKVRSFLKQVKKKLITSLKRSSRIHQTNP